MTILLFPFFNNIWVLFLSSIVICSILEYLTSYYMEKRFKVRWWDYSTKKFNLNGRICLQNSLAFGIFGTLIIRYINPLIFRIINKINPNVLHIVCLLLLIIIVLDYSISSTITNKIKAIATKEVKDNTEEITALVKEEILKQVSDFKLKIIATREAHSLNIRNRLKNSSYLYRRIVTSYPKLEIKHISLKQIKKKINNKKEDK